MTRLAVPVDPFGARIADPVERMRIAAFLNAGTIVLFTTDHQWDQVCPDLGAVVGRCVRTDGAWAWTDAHAYYAAVHGIAPEPDLMHHLRARDYQCRPLPDTQRKQVLAALFAG